MLLILVEVSVSGLPKQEDTDCSTDRATYSGGSICVSGLLHATYFGGSICVSGLGVPTSPGCVSIMLLATSYSSFSFNLLGAKS